LNALFSTNSVSLIALHGWGMNASVWAPVANLLPSHIPFYALDLPGHGICADLAEASMPAMVQWLSQQFDGPCHLLGWSMGGLVAQAFALAHPERVASLSLVASTPSFVKREGWSCGLEGEVLQQFSDNLQNNQKATLRRFIALQFMGESATAPLQKQLRNNVLAQLASEQALTLGLSWLQHCDYREQLMDLPPQHWMFGGLDRLIPPTAGQAVVDLVPKASVSYFDECGHAPFMTQPERFTQQLLAFFDIERA